MKYPINVSFDTNIFDSCNYNISEGSELHTLIKYVEDGFISVQLSNIVVNEMKSHCIEKATKFYDSIKSSIQIGRQLNLSSIPTLPKKENLAQEAQSFIDELIKRLNASIMDYAGITIECVFDNYFKRIPPFEEKKKSEFPDAVITMQIKQTYNNDKPIYFVSKDEGVKAALSDVEYCKIYTSLSSVFDMITKDREEFTTIQKLITDLIPDIQKSVQSKLDNEDCISLSGQSHDASGNIYGYDYTNIRYYNKVVNNVSIFTIDFFDEKVICVRMRCKALIDAECQYDNNSLLPGINIEKHKANFAVSVVVNRQKQSIDSMKFHVFLGGDSRYERYAKYEHSKPYTTCPDCGADIYIENDGGNGFCINCAPNH